VRTVAADELPVPDVPSRVRLAGRALLWLGVVAPLTLYAAVVLESPPDILDRFQALKRFSEAVREHLLEVSPAFDIHQHALSTAFPQVAMLASSLGVLLVAYIAAAFALRTLLHFRYIQHLLRSPVQGIANRVGGLVVLPLVGLFLVWAVYCLPGDWSRAQGLTTQSRNGYALVSLCAVAAAGVGVGMWLAQVRLLCRDVFSKVAA